MHFQYNFTTEKADRNKQEVVTLVAKNFVV